MFIGSIPQELRSVVHEHTEDWQVRDVWVGCSGNFTVERSLLDRGFTLHGNDVSLYTSCVGSWLSDQGFRLEVKEQYAGRWGWLDEFLDTPQHKVATVMLATQMLNSLHRNNAYYERWRRGYHAQWRELFEKTNARLEDVQLRLGSFSSMDVGDYLDIVVPQDAAVVSFPPFYAGGYEQIYRGLEEVFDWDRPDYPEMDRDGLHAVLAKMRERPLWWYAVDHRLDGEDTHLRGILQKRSSVPIYVYCSQGPKRVVAIRPTTQPVLTPRLVPGDEIGSKITFAPLNSNQYAAMRAQYLAPNILGSTPAAAYAVLADGKIIGVLGFKREDAKVARGDLFLVSDFAVAPTDYKRLSKLVLWAALSEEMLHLLQRRFGKVRTVVTSAFTNRPTSMKYRGTFDLINRVEEGKGGSTQGRKYKLVYLSRLGRWPLDEAYARWKDQHA